MSSPHTQLITLYSAKVCPYAHRVEIALAEANAKFKIYHIDLANKPDWYAPKVNPASKVPVIAYGGPDVAPENPSPQSTKLAESLVLVEFVADLYPQANLLPQDPVLRAKARFFIEVVSSKFSPGYGKFVIRGEGYRDLLLGVEAVQEILPDSGKYAIGDQYTIADVALTSFIARVKLASENELGKFEAGQGEEFVKALDSPKYAKFNAYVERLLERPSFKATFDKEYIKGAFEKRFARA
ncbi:hypothetical protein PAXRUDRAFT_824930 [Paxillus rubicundulus Ve08.2h10]|uniref:Glutathione transferase n=1 Tax=Paxillus rubicundulus Ve08.2h10 TaxID=930991 RepID=A0A0D0E177_9AGAM|nr:hypothetical protein PAXRUDRAFT_824930 [Paxillus rubicundulus Ve08.2h10]